MKKFLCILILSVFLIAPVAEGAEWIVLRETSIGTASYDRESIKQYPGNLITVSVKYDYSPEGIKEFREAFQEVNKSEEIRYTLYVYEMHCSAESFRLIKATTYNSAQISIKGTDLDSTLTAQSPLEHITPGSIMENLYNASCTWIRYNPPSAISQ